MKGFARVFLNLAAVLGFSRGPVLREETKNQQEAATKRDAVSGFLSQFRVGFPKRAHYYLPKGDWTVRYPEVKLDPIQRARVDQAERERREAKENRRSAAWARTCETRKTPPEREHSPGLLALTHARVAELRGRRLMRSERRAARLAAS